MRLYSFKPVYLLIAFCSILLLCTTSCGNRGLGKTKGLKTIQVGKTTFQEGAYSTILDKAETSGMPIFVDFSADWCLPCKQMDKNVFTNATLARQLNENFISYKVDADTKEGQMLQTVYGISMLPTLLFLDNGGEMIYKEEGYTSAETLISLSKRVSKNPS